MFVVLLPMLVCEFMWSLGENIYAVIYGHMGTDASAAMTLINPVQGLMSGALCGFSQAASVIIGKKLGVGAYEEAYQASRKLLYYGFAGSALLSVVILAAFTLNLSIPYVYFILSLEECIRFMISYVVLRRRKWMVTFAA